MSKQKQSTFKTKVGGQALIEGVMMRGVDKAAMAVLLPDKTIDVESWEITPSKKRNLFFRLPLVRGVVNLIEKFGDAATTGLFRVTMVIATVLAVVLAVGLFIYLPALAARSLGSWLEVGYLQGIIEGVIKIVIFVLYLFLVSRMKDMRRMFQFHGAEHKTIACYEAGEELTPENAKKFKRFHPRCGTSFLLIVLILGIIVFSVVTWDSLLIRTVLKVVLIPVVVGLAYEIIRLAGRYDNIVTRIVSAPGLWLQRITTNEPDEEQLRVAIAAVKPVLPEDREEGRW